jgi:hypothetical protein
MQKYVSLFQGIVAAGLTQYRAFTSDEVIHYLPSYSLYSKDLKNM